MKTSSESDLIEEVEELLANVQYALPLSIHDNGVSYKPHILTAGNNILVSFLSDDFAELFVNAPELLRRLVEKVKELRQANADLTAANLSTLLGEMKGRLTPEEGEQFQSLLMAATKDWVDDVTAPRTKKQQRIRRIN